MEVLQTSGRCDVNQSNGSALHSINERFSQLLPYRTPFPPDLVAIVDAWPTMPEAIKAGIIAMVKAASAKSDQ
jgi:hypothetical protein